MSKREPKMHARGTRRTFCGLTGVASTELVDLVTCNRCVFQLLSLGEIRPEDTRVTPPMRARGGFVVGSKA